MHLHVYINTGLGLGTLHHPHPAPGHPRPQSSAQDHAILIQGSPWAQTFGSKREATAPPLPTLWTHREPRRLDDMTLAARSGLQGGVSTPGLTGLKTQELLYVITLPDACLSNPSYATVSNSLSLGAFLVAGTGSICVTPAPFAALSRGIKGHTPSTSVPPTPNEKPWADVCWDF